LDSDKLKSVRLAGFGKRADRSSGSRPRNPAALLSRPPPVRPIRRRAADAPQTAASPLSGWPRCCGPGLRLCATRRAFAAPVGGDLSGPCRREARRDRRACARGARRGPSTILDIRVIILGSRLIILGSRLIIMESAPQIPPSRGQRGPFAVALAAGLAPPGGRSRHRGGGLDTGRRRPLGQNIRAPPGQRPRKPPGPEHSSTPKAIQKTGLESKFASFRQATAPTLGRRLKRPFGTD